MRGQSVARYAAFLLSMTLCVVRIAHGGPAAGGGGGHGGGHGGATHGAAAGGHGAHSGWGFHGGGRSAHHGYVWHGARGWRSGGGWRGGYYGHTWCWGLGIYLPLLPWYSVTWWSGGMPYYGVDSLYYVWDGDAGVYQAVAPPADLSPTPAQGTPASGSEPSVSSELYAYPRAGQSDAQQEQDKAECRHWAETQTGFDPTGTIPTPWTTLQAYLRADAACLQARYYSVR